MSSTGAPRRGPLGWAKAAVKRVFWVARKFGYYCLPPALYDTVRFPVRMLLPRALQQPDRARLRTALGRLFGRTPPPPTLADLLPAEIPRPAALPPPDPSTPVGFSDPEAARTHVLYQQYHRQTEITRAEVEAKLVSCRATAAGVRQDRVRMARELARLERLLGNDLKAALYLFRCMRLSGFDRYGDAGWVRATLEKHDLPAEGEAVWAMYAAGVDHDAECARLLAAARERHRPPPAADDEYTVFDDRRGDHRPRVSVIITVYNAAAKIGHFLSALQLQTLNRRGEVELVIVDSNSPQDEYAAWKAVELAHPIPTLFVRTRQRETIQTAWNRALGLVRGDYISLLGADEAIVPNTLERLAGVLDAEPHTDWVQGNILLTEVDKHGNQSADVMTYDKTGYVNDLVSLETCYLGPVGAMHRKALHPRLGYFDGTFRGAGDTEFKNRVLPGLKVTTVPDLLGLYVNYPEERTTQSPRAELEDIRAWYLHRTPAGIRYAFADRPVEDLERQLVRSLWYRKSYLQKMSTDFAYAEAVVQVLGERAPHSPVLAALGPGVRKMVAAHRALDHLPGVRPDVWHAHITHQRNVMYEVLVEHRRTGLFPPDLDYWYFNDNSHEQHQHLW